MSTKLSRIAEVAKEKRSERFTSLAHLLDEGFLKETWLTINKKGVAGVDSITIEEYESNLQGNIGNLVSRLKAGKYRATPFLMVEIPKQGGVRNLSIPIVEDRLLQKAVSRILGEIFEQDFQSSSFGFRRGLGPHKALQSLRQQIAVNKTMWIYEVDIKGYFNNVNRDWLMRMLKERITDPVILQLIGKWLKAGVLKDGILIVNKQGTPQGGPISCVLSNIYLHYVLDLWFERSVKPRLKGQAKLVRFVDDFVICFQEFHDATKVKRVLDMRLAKFGLEIAPEKSSLLCFGRFAKERRESQGKRTETFTFLGFKHVCGTDRKGRFCLVRIPSTKSCSKFLKKTKEWLWKHMHFTVRQHQEKLTQMLRGFYNYFGLTHCCHKMDLVQYRVKRQWKRVLSRRSQKGPYRYWSFLTQQDWFKLPNPKVYHPNI